MSKAKRSAHPKSEKKLRPLRSARLVAGPAGTSIRTRLRVSDRDAEVLLALGKHLGHLANVDLVRAQRGVSRRERKQALTAVSSSRYAGAITAETERRRKSEQSNQRRHRSGLVQAIAAITTRLDLDPAEGGYPNGAVRYQKQVRLRILVARLADIEPRSVHPGSSHPSIVRGGHRLWGNRAEIENVLRRKLAKTEDPAEQQAAQDEAACSSLAWRDRWEASRSFIRALGSKDELDGNLTIRVNPISGRCSLLLPVTLRAYANDKFDRRYILDARAIFSYREPEWRERTTASAITYTITHHPEQRDRWYLDASWSYASLGESPMVSAGMVSTEAVKSKICTPASTPPGPTLVHGRALGVDFNADHLAAWILDEYGNPVGIPYRIPLLVKGLSTPVRDGHVRDAVSTLLRICEEHGVTTIVCEDLGWSDATGRDEASQGRAFRHLISGFLTTIFRDRLAAMATRVGISVVAIDPAYTSKWGSAFWVRPTSTIKHPTSPHAAAAIVIGRRGQCYRASRRIGVTSHDQSDQRKRATLQGYPVTDHQVQEILPRTTEQSVGLEHLIPWTRLATTVRAGPADNTRQQS